MDLYDRIGVAALGSRLRRLGDRMAEDASKVFELFDNPMQPRWYPVFQVLSERGPEAVTAVATDIGQSHASVSQIAKEMEKAGLLKIEKGKLDTRKSFLRLTEKGLAIVPRLEEQIETVRIVAEKLVSESAHNLWLAVADCERALVEKSLFDRVKSEKAGADGERIRIVTYRKELAGEFHRLNEEWITTYFTMEDSDRAQLLNPDGAIISKGGQILFARIGDESVGTCALIPHGEGCLELAKMAITPHRRGLGLGMILGKSAIDEARRMGADRIYLESNRKLIPAIRLYRSLGFVEVIGGVSPYARADIQMELELV